MKSRKAWTLERLRRVNNRDFRETFQRQQIIIGSRFYQSLGLPLRKIRDELYGKSADDLAALERQAVRPRGKAAALNLPLAPLVASESWSATPLAGNFLLISRDHQSLPRTIVDKINQLLLSVAPAAGRAAAAADNKL